MFKALRQSSGSFFYFGVDIIFLCHFGVNAHPNLVSFTLQSADLGCSIFIESFLFGFWLLSFAFGLTLGTFFILL